MPKTLGYRCVFEKSNHLKFSEPSEFFLNIISFLNLHSLKNVTSDVKCYCLRLQFEKCAALIDFELTTDGDIRTHPLIEMLTHLKMVSSVKVFYHRNIYKSCGGFDDFL